MLNNLIVKGKEIAAHPVYGKLTVGMILAAAGGYLIWKRYK